MSRNETSVACSGSDTTAIITCTDARAAPLVDATRYVRAVVDGLEIVDEDPRSPVGWDLMDRLMDDVAERYEDDDRPADLVPDGVEGDDGAFLVAYVDGHAVGCAALRPVGPGLGELKRMYVDPLARGKGIGAALLAGIEARAVTLGYAQLKLETGLM